MTRDEFLAGVAEMQGRYPDLRYGQTVFNLASVTPELSNAVDSMDGMFGVDPFYQDEFVPEFLAGLPFEENET